MTLRHQGHVTFFCPAKGWGFIRPETAGDVFVHYTGIAQAHGYRKLEMNQRVEFEIEETPTGRQAKKVTMLTPLTAQFKVMRPAVEDALKQYRYLRGLDDRGQKKE